MTPKNGLILKAKNKRRQSHRIFSVRLPKDLVAKLDKLAEESGHSRNELISTFIEFSTANCVVEK